MWDSLGYLRVRSLANPNWRRDVHWLVGQLRREEHSSYIDDAIRAAQRYGELGPNEDREAAWDEVLEPIDHFLELRQARHIQDVLDAGASGRSRD
jgi:hypothetical protein